jgi:hypothetical protein
MAVRAIRVIPILRIFSPEKAREFYLDYLGCHLDWEHRFAPTAPVYMQVSRDELVLHLSEHYGEAHRAPISEWTLTASKSFMQS